jgi:hypothetical protein
MNMLSFLNRKESDASCLLKGETEEAIPTFDTPWGNDLRRLDPWRRQGVSVHGSQSCAHNECGDKKHRNNR